MKTTAELREAIEETRAAGRGRGRDGYSSALRAAVVEWSARMTVSARPGPPTGSGRAYYWVSVEPGDLTAAAISWGSGTGSLRSAARTA